MVAAKKAAPVGGAVKKSARRIDAPVTAVRPTRVRTARKAVSEANGVQHATALAGMALAPDAASAKPRRKRAASAATPAPVAVPVQNPGRKRAAAAKPAPEFARPHYWDKACADLVKRDRILKKLIPQFGPVALMTRGDPFVTLARSIVGQQISVQAAQAVWLRIQAACPKLTPAQFIKVGHDKLIATGLSKRKSEYILDLARHFVSGALHVDTWASMDDEAVIAELTQIRGIGRWTAEMFLIFNLLRPDVLPLDDIGLIRAISVNYFSGEPVTRSEAREVAANWEPWRTVATWYMWRSLDPLPVEY